MENRGDLGVYHHHDFLMQKSQFGIRIKIICDVCIRVKQKEIKKKRKKSWTDISRRNKQTLGSPELLQILS